MWRRKTNPVDIGIGLLVIALAVVLFRDSPRVYSVEQPTLDLSLRFLPFYALASVSRMIAAIIVSLILALLAGYLAAVNRYWRNIILPAADILQSVPVLGFFPAAVFLFIRLFGNSYPAIGVEMAAIFLIITSALWNMIFAVYESITTIPEDLRLASRQFGLKRYTYWTRLVLPAVMHKLAYNAMISWANGWYFLIASEIIVLGNIHYQLPGLGSYLAQTMSSGDYSHGIYALLLLVAIIAGFHLVVWSPLNDWSIRFVYDGGETASWREMHPRSRFRFHMARSRILNLAWVKVFRPIIRRVVSFVSFVLDHQRRQTSNAIFLATMGLFVILIAQGVTGVLPILTEPSEHLREIPIALLLSFLRLLAAYALALLWTLPLAVWIGRNERAFRRVMPIVEVIASIPATAFFPFIVLTIVSLGGGMNLASILLVTTGMQWYLLFNLIAGIRAIPDDLYQISNSLGLTGATRWKRLIIPAIFPSLITGSLTAAGGGWNALVLSEYVTAEGELYRVRGIGALLAQGTWEGSGDLQLIVLSIAAMVLFILIVNKLVWQPAYELAQRRFALNY